MLGEGVEKRKPSYTLGRNVNWCRHCGNNMELPQKTKNRITMWPNNPTPGIYTDKTITQKGTCTPIFITALFTKAKTWKQAKCPLADEWIKISHTDNRIVLSHKKEQNNAICSNMDATRNYHTITIWYHLDVECKIWYTWTYLWNKQSQGHRDKLVVAKQSWGREGWSGTLGLADANWYI